MVRTQDQQFKLLQERKGILFILCNFVSLEYPLNTCDLQEGEALRVIPLSVILDAIETDQVSKSKRHCFKLITSKRPFIVCAPNEESEAAWLGALQMTLKKAKEKLKEEEDAVKPVIVSPKA